MADLVSCPGCGQSPILHNGAPHCPRCGWDSRKNGLVMTEAATRARVRAYALTRAISGHHAEHQPCVGPRRASVRGFVRAQCEVERRLLAELADAQQAGWPQ